MKLIDTKYTLLAVAAAALLSVGCAEDDGLGDGGDAFNDQGAQDEGALGEPGGAQDEGAFGDEGGVQDEGAFGDQDADDPGIGQPEPRADEQVAQSPGDQGVGGDTGADPQQGSEVVSTYPAFEEVDTNSDGMIDRPELASIEGLDFASLDTNQDGSLSQEEYAAAEQQQ